MFDIMKVARNIKEARIARDMTQMNLADAMEVSYQAVSNWERGNSMPDIAKLGQLCEILQIRLDQLLGTEEEANTIAKVIHRDEDGTAAVTMEEIKNIVPLLPPEEVKRLVSENLQETSKQDEIRREYDSTEEPEQEKHGAREKRKMDSSTLIELAPYLEEDDLGEILQDFEVEMDIKTVMKLAPFLNERTLDELVLHIKDEIGREEIMKLVPFLGQKCLEELISRCKEDIYLEHVRRLAPFVSSNCLKELVKKAKD